MLDACGLEFFLEAFDGDVEEQGAGCESLRYSSLSVEAEFSFYYSHPAVDQFEGLNFLFIEYVFELESVVHFVSAEPVVGALEVEECEERVVAPIVLPLCVQFGFTPIVHLLLAVVDAAVFPEPTLLFNQSLVAVFFQLIDYQALQQFDQVGGDDDGPGLVDSGSVRVVLIQHY